MSKVRVFQIICVLLTTGIVVGYVACGKFEAVKPVSKADLSSPDLRAVGFSFWGEMALGIVDSQEAQGFNPMARDLMPVENPICQNGKVNYDNETIFVNCADYNDLLSVVGRRFSVTASFWKDQNQVRLGAGDRITKLSLEGLDLGPNLQGRLPQKVEMLSLANTRINKIELVWNSVLRQLDLSGNMLSDEEIQRQAFPSTLTHLNLGANLVKRANTYLDRALPFVDVRDNPLCGADSSKSPHVTCQFSSQVFHSELDFPNDCSGFAFDKVTVLGETEAQNVFMYYKVASVPRTCILKIGMESYCIHNHAVNGSYPMQFISYRGGDVSASPATFDPIAYTCALELNSVPVPVTINEKMTQAKTQVELSDVVFEQAAGRIRGVSTITRAPLSDFFDSEICSGQINCNSHGTGISYANGQFDLSSGVCRFLTREQISLRSNCFYFKTPNFFWSVSLPEFEDIEFVETDLSASFSSRVVSDSPGRLVLDFTTTFNQPAVTAGTKKLKLVHEYWEGGQYHYNRIGSCFDSSPTTIRGELSFSGYVYLKLANPDQCGAGDLSGEVLATRFELVERPVSIGNFLALACAPVPGAPHLCATRVSWNVYRMDSSKKLVLQSYNARTGNIHAQNIACVDTTGEGGVDIQWASVDSGWFEFQLLDSCTSAPDRSKAQSYAQIGWSGCASSAFISLYRVGPNGESLAGDGTCAIPAGQTQCSPAPKVRLVVSGNSRPQNRVVVRVNGGTDNFIGEVVNSNGFDADATFVTTSESSFKAHVLCEHGAVRDVPGELKIRGIANSNPPPSTTSTTTTLPEPGTVTATLQVLSPSYGSYDPMNIPRQASPNMHLGELAIIRSNLSGYQSGGHLLQVSTVDSSGVVGYQDVWCLNSAELHTPVINWLTDTTDFRALLVPNCGDDAGEVVGSLDIGLAPIVTSSEISVIDAASGAAISPTSIPRRPPPADHLGVDVFFRVATQNLVSGFVILEVTKPGQPSAIVACGGAGFDSETANWVEDGMSLTTRTAESCDNAGPNSVETSVPLGLGLQ